MQYKIFLEIEVNAEGNPAMGEQSVNSSSSRFLNEYDFTYNKVEAWINQSSAFGISLLDAEIR